MVLQGQLLLASAKMSKKGVNYTVLSLLGTDQVIEIWVKADGLPLESVQPYIGRKVQVSVPSQRLYFADKAVLTAP